MSSTPPLSSILVNNRVIVIENRQKIFQLQLQQSRVINYNFVNYNYNFSKPAFHNINQFFHLLFRVKSSSSLFNFLIENIYSFVRALLN